MHISEVLHHLVTHARGLSDANRAEFHEAIDDEYHPEEAAAARAAAAEAERNQRNAKIAQLKAELGELEAGDGDPPGPDPAGE